MNRLKRRKPPELTQVQRLIRQWLEQFQHCVKMLDYAQAEKMFDQHIIAFDAKENFVYGMNDLRKLWEIQWPMCDRFEFDLNGTKALVGNPYVSICTVWQAAFGNGEGLKGRATFVFRGGAGLVITNEPKVDHLICVHSHMSEVG
jgi:hypothetical protein